MLWPISKYERAYIYNIQYSAYVFVKYQCKHNWTGHWLKQSRANTHTHTLQQQQQFVQNDFFEIKIRKCEAANAKNLNDLLICSHCTHRIIAYVLYQFLKYGNARIQFINLNDPNEFHMRACKINVNMNRSSSSPCCRRVKFLVYCALYCSYIIYFASFFYLFIHFILYLECNWSNRWTDWIKPHWTNLFVLHNCAIVVQHILNV